MRSLKSESSPMKDREPKVNAKYVVDEYGIVTLMATIHHPHDSCEKMSRQFRFANSARRKPELASVFAEELWIVVVSTTTCNLDPILRGRRTVESIKLQAARVVKGWNYAGFKRDPKTGWKHSFDDPRPKLAEA